MADDASVLALALPWTRFEEGFRGQAYPDPLTGGRPWTVGYGATGPDIGPGAVWTLDEAEQALEGRCSGLCGQLDQEIPWWRSLGPVRAAVLVSMAYQLGLEGLLAFHHMLLALRGGNFMMASAEMLLSEWAEQTPARAQRLAARMRTGEAA